MKRVRMTLDEIRAESTYYLETHDKSAGICALVDVENMGFCKDGVTRRLRGQKGKKNGCLERIQ